jgi:hypothetical protein
VGGMSRRIKEQNNFFFNLCLYGYATRFKYGAEDAKQPELPYQTYNVVLFENVAKVQL